jgi:tetratricopeptide (TPR) repeat protein
MRRLWIVAAALVMAVMLVKVDRVAAQVNLPDPARVNVNFESDPEGAMRAAREKVAAGDLPGAIRQLATYVVAHPKEADPARLLGDLYFRTSQLERAEAAYLAILKQYPYDKETHNRLGTVYATVNRVDDAIDQFNKSLPGTDSVGDLVALHLRKGDLPRYQGEMERLAVTYPTSPELQAELGQVYFALHRPIDAVKYFRRALDNDPRNLTALNGLGLAYLDLHAYSDAIAQFDACNTIYQNYSCLDNLGAADLEMKRGSDAERVLTMAHHMQPERPEALVNFGYLADDRGDWKTAVTYYLRALSVSPYSREAYINLGYEYESRGLYTQAEAVLLKGIAVAPEEGRLHFLLGQTYVDQGHMDLALVQFKAAQSSLDPDVARIARARFNQLEKKPPNQ